MTELACITAGFLAAIASGHLTTAHLLQSGESGATALSLGIATSFFACAGWAFTLGWMYRPRQ